VRSPRRPNNREAPSPSTTVHPASRCDPVIRSLTTGLTGSYPGRHLPADELHAPRAGRSSQYQHFRARYTAGLRK
jgi:hypothetical protein